MKLASANKIVIGHLNINSIRNKFDCFKYLTDGNIDIILLSETKLNYTFPVSQFQLMDPMPHVGQAVPVVYFYLFVSISLPGK